MTPQDIKTASTSTLYELFDTYSSLQARGVRDEIIQELIAQELDLREQGPRCIHV